MKLEIAHLAPYLPYNLRVIYDGDYNQLLLGLYEDQVITDCDETYLDFIKPILRPLSDLNNVYNKTLGLRYRGLINMSEHQFKTNSLQNYVMNKVSYWDFNKLLENHFDVFGLIPAGLAIDINTIK